jgi:hypothetical protein
MHWRKIVVGITLSCMLFVHSGCYSINLVNRQEMAEHPNYPIIAVITSDGEYLEFEPEASLKDSVIIGRLVEGPTVELTLAEVDSIYVKKAEKYDHKEYQKYVCCISCLGIVITLIIVVTNWIEKAVEELY